MKAWVVLVSVLAALPLSAAAGNDGKVQVITSFNQAAKCISPVAIKKIDGREATVQRMGFWIEPGKHTLSGSAVVDTSFCQTIGFDSDRFRPEPIEVEFELGKVYYIGLDHSSANREDWKYVVWKVKDAKQKG